jgi:uncharacterized protein
MKLVYRFAVCAGLAFTALSGATGCAVDATEEGELDATSKAAGRFEIFRGVDNQYYFHLIAGNGEKVLQSEGYLKLAGAQTGVDSVRQHAVDAKGMKLLQATDGQWYFNVVSTNNKIVATSELYTTKSNAQRAQKMVQQLVKLANREMAATTGGATFKVFKSSNDGQYYFNITGGNGEIMLQSEGYTTKSAALKGVASVRTNGGELAGWEVIPAANGQFFIQLFADNNELIARGETYSSKSNADKAVARLVDLLHTDKVADAK